MLDRLKLYFLSAEKKLSYIEDNAVKIGARSINGASSVLYMLGSDFFEIIETPNNQKRVKFFKTMKELNERY